ncbi:MAG: hypothetical protein KKE24_00870 [Candidatus Thermoplasmatota archaeon]|nr:hypothetical protein [Candidatus Thermoplasmatota archaeon]
MTDTESESETRSHNKKVDSINKSGYGFQRKIALEISSTEKWDVEIEKPLVRFEERSVEEVKVDILARSRRKFSDMPRAVSVIECKRHDPKYSEWLFFSRGSNLGEIEGREKFPSVWCHLTGGSYSFDNKHHKTGRMGMYEGYFPSLAEWADIKYSDSFGVPTRRDGTIGAADSGVIQHAANQVARGVLGAVHSLHEYRNSRRKERFLPLTGNHLVLPVLVTTAPIYVCHVDDAATDLLQGSIPPDGLETESKKCLLFRYSLPIGLWFPPDTLAGDGLPDLTSLSVWVVSSSFCKEFFSLVDKDAAHWQEMAPIQGQ